MGNATRQVLTLGAALWLALAAPGCGSDPDEPAQGPTPVVRPGQGVTLAQGEVSLGDTIEELRERFGEALVERDLGPAGLWFELPSLGVAGHARSEEGALQVDGLELVAPCGALTDAEVGVGSTEAELRAAHPNLGAEPFLGTLRGVGVAYDVRGGVVWRVLVYP